MRPAQGLIVGACLLLLSAPLARGAVEIVIDASETPKLKEWSQTTLRPVLEKWYPIIEQMLPSDGFEPPRRFTVKFFKDMKGVANTSGTLIRCAEPWFGRNLQGEAIGAVVHEMVHVVQQYPGGHNPGWLVEGLADYVRWFKYEAPSLRPRPNPAKAKYTDSYRTTAAFLNYAIETHDKDLARELNAALREDRYSPELWTKFTGKTVDQLWDEYTATLRK